jgi:site-specific recombinase XerD
MGAAEIQKFLTYLAVERQVSASTENQALAALLFLYSEVLRLDLPWHDKFTPARKSVRLPVVLTKEEVRETLKRLEGLNWLVANLLYGRACVCKTRSGCGSSLLISGINKSQ